MKNFIQNEPVVTTTVVVGAIMAVIAALVQLNVFQLTPEQTDAIQNALMAIVPLFMLGAGLIARQFVTPVKGG